MASVLVCGSATANVQPDRALVSLGLTHVAPDAGSAMDEIGRRSRQLDEMLTGFGFERAEWVTDGINVGEEWQWKNDTNTLVGYRATSGVAVTVRQFAIIGQLVRDAVTGCGATIRSLQWFVDDHNPAHTTLLAEAAADAKRRATAYTSALGLRLGEVELISETPISTGPVVPQAEVMTMRAAKMDAEPMSVSDGVITLSSAVHVRFAVLPS